MKSIFGEQVNNNSEYFYFYVETQAGSAYVLHIKKVLKQHVDSLGNKYKHIGYAEKDIPVFTNN